MIVFIISVYFLFGLKLNDQFFHINIMKLFIKSSKMILNGTSDKDYLYDDAMIAKYHIVIRSKLSISTFQFSQ